jgi:hypothetical protein
MSDFAQIRFQPNRPLLRELSADRLNTILQEIKRNKPKGERGITVRQDGTGTYIGLAASLPRGGGTSTAPHPFRVITRNIEDQWYWGVIYESRVYTNLFASSELVGLLTNEADDEDPGWKPITYTEEKDYIYLQWDESEGEASVDSVGDNGALNPDSDLGDSDSQVWIDFEELPPEFKAARKIIAVATESEDGSPAISQGIKQHQLLQNVCFNGNPIKWWFDYSTENIG